MEMFIWTTLNGKVSYYKSKMKFEVKNLLQGEEDHSRNSPRDRALI